MDCFMVSSWICSIICYCITVAPCIAFGSLTCLPSGLLHSWLLALLDDILYGLFHFLPVASLHGLPSGLLLGHIHAYCFDLLHGLLHRVLLGIFHRLFSGFLYVLRLICHMFCSILNSIWFLCGCLHSWLIALPSSSMVCFIVGSMFCSMVYSMVCFMLYVWFSSCFDIWFSPCFAPWFLI